MKLYKFVIHFDDNKTLIKSKTFSSMQEVDDYIDYLLDTYPNIVIIYSEEI